MGEGGRWREGMREGVERGVPSPSACFGLRFGPFLFALQRSRLIKLLSMMLRPFCLPFRSRSLSTTSPRFRRVLFSLHFLLPLSSTANSGSQSETTT